MKNIFADFIVNKGLYDSTDINEDNINDLIGLLNGDVRIDVYCIHCKCKRPFQMKPIYIRDWIQEGQIYSRKLSDELKDTFNRPHFVECNTSSKPDFINWKWFNDDTSKYVRVMNFSFECTMCKQELDYVVNTTTNKMIKIGQNPSIADLSFQELDLYKNEISKEMRAEFGRAIGLYANGIGVGSYVYLRRIFERLLLKAKEEAELYGNKKIEGFNGLRMDQKIDALNSFLPSFLTSNKEIYGIISKGIHELSEEECLEYFPVLKNSILLILHEWSIKESEQKMKDNISSALNVINSKIKGDI